MSTKEAHKIAKPDAVQVSELRSYQRKGVRKLHKFKGRALLADEMGLGKTPQALKYHEECDHKKVIVLCPAILKDNWKKETRKFIGAKAHIINHNFRGDLDQLRSINKRRINIINYDILGSWLEAIRNLDPDLIIIDEVHYIKNRKAKRTKYTKELCEGVKEVIGLSGTPLVSIPAELFPFLHICRPDLFPSFFRFATRYCKPQLKPWGWEFKGATNLPELHKLLKKNLMIRRRKIDVLKELPLKTRVVLPVEISDKQEYKFAYNDFITWLSHQSMSRAKRASKAEQLTRVGYLKRLVAKLKLDAITTWLQNFLEESDGKVLVFGVHKNILNELHNRFPKNSTVIHGDISRKKRRSRIRRAKRSKRKRILFGQLDLMGKGLNLQEYNTVLFAELGWTPGEHTQAEDRAHRYLQELPVTCYYLIGKGTIEERLCELIQEKQGVLDTTLDGTDSPDSLNIFNQFIEELEKEAT